MNTELYGIIFAVLIVSTVILYIGSRLVLKVKKKILILSLIIFIVFYVIIIFMQIFNLILSNILVIILSILAGYFVFKSFNTENLWQLIIVFAIITSLMDYFSFGGGLTNEIIRSWEEESNVLLLFLCITIEVGPTIVPIVGIGDLFNITLFFCALDQLNYFSELNFLVKRMISYLVPTLGLLTALIIGFFVGGIYGIPFIAATSITFVLINQWKINKDEVKIKQNE